MSATNKAASTANHAVTSADSVGENINALRDEVNALIGEFKDAAQDKLPEFRSRLKQIAGSVEGTGSRLVDQAASKGRQLTDRTKDSLFYACDATEELIAAHPWKAITVVAAATLAAGLLLNRRP